MSYKVVTTATTFYASTAGVSTYSNSAGITTYATNAGIATYATSSGIATYATSSGIATYATSSGIATYATSSGIATYATSAGIATYSTSSGVSTSVIGGIGSITQLQVTDVSTFTNGPVLVGSASSQGTVNQTLQVTGGVYVSGNIGIGTTNPTSALTVQGDTLVSGVTTSIGGFISVANTTPVTIKIENGSLIFSAVGIGSTSFILG